MLAILKKNQYLKVDMNEWFRLSHVLELYELFNSGMYFIQLLKV